MTSQGRAMAAAIHITKRQMMTTNWGISVRSRERCQTMQGKGKVSSRLGTLESTIALVSQSLEAGGNIVQDLDSRVGIIYSYGFLIVGGLVAIGHIAKQITHRMPPLDALWSWTKGRRHIKPKDWEQYAKRLEKDCNSCGVGPSRPET